jgi:hypothetical protein
MQSFMAIGSNMKEICSYLVLVVPSAPLPRWGRLACVFPMIRHSGGQALRSQCVSYTYTHLCKFSWSYEPQHPKYKHHRVAAPAMPTATQYHLAISFPGYPMVETSCTFATTYSIQSITSPQNGSQFGAAMTMFLVIITAAVRHWVCSTGAQIVIIVFPIDLAFTLVQPFVIICSMCALHKSIVIHNSSIDPCAL